MAQRKAVAPLARYLPRLLLRRVPELPGEPRGAAQESLVGAFLLADISGFTPLAESLAAKGRSGSEELSRILNGYFTRLIESVERHGGDVLKFAGDALLALWTAPADDLGEPTWRAARCAHEIQEDLRGYQAAGRTLSLRIAVGAGEARVSHLGGVSGRWELVVAGAAITQVGNAIEHAASGHNVASPEALDALGGRARAGRAAPEAIELVAVSPLPTDAAEASWSGELEPEDEEVCRAYLPDSLVYRLDAGQAGYVGELRTTTILFVHLPGLGADTPLDHCQTLVQSVQESVYDPYEGSLNKISVDEKGICLVVVLGLPPLAHEDDPVRGVRAALAVRARLADLDEPCSIGVTTGRVYCGEIGSETRREYTILGDSVNLSARLMQAARGGILCDAATCQRVEDAIELSDPEPLQLKGKAGTLTARRALGPRRRESLGGSSASPTLVGRAGESERLARSLGALVESGRGSTWIVEGEAGIGKSTLLHDLWARAGPLEISRLQGVAEAIEQSTSYFAWRPVLLSLLGLEPGASPEECERVLALRLAGNPRRQAMAPLLGPVLGVSLADSPLTSQMQGEVRAENTRELVVGLFAEHARERPILLSLDDVHWMDSASWALALDLRQAVPRLLLVLLSRPLEREPAEYTRITALPDTHVIRLDRLSLEESVALVARRLGVQSLPPVVAQWIQDRAEGHPFFGEELGYAIRDAGVIEIEGDLCRMAPGVSDLASLDLPDTVEGIITSRIDRLTPQQQLTLKIASVIGRVFELRVLRDVHPVDDTRDELGTQLEVLASQELTLPESLDASLSYVFKHAITREVAYELLLYAQRETLHGAIARWYERSGATLQASLYPLLAHHWSHAGVGEKAIDYLERSARDALRSHASAEAHGFMTQALEWHARGDLPVASERLARWHAIRGEAGIGVGRLHEARADLEEATRQVGLDVPTGGLRMAWALLRAIARQCANRLPRAWHVDRAPREGPWDMAAAAYERLFLIYYFAGDAPRALLGTLRAVNLAELTGDASPVRSRCFASLGVALGSIPLHRIARFYLRWGLRECEGRSLSEQTWVHLGAATYAAGVGDWTAVERHAAHGLRISEELGDRRRWEELAASLCLIRILRGHLDPSEHALYRQVLESGTRREVVQAQAWGLSEWALTLLALDAPAPEHHEVLSRLETLLAEHAADVDEVTRLEGIAALAHRGLRAHDLADATAWIERGMDLLEQMGRPSQYRNLPCTGALADAILALHPALPAPAQPRMLRWLHTLERYLASYARIFPIGRPRLAYVRAAIADRSGHPHRARVLLTRSLGTARALDMPHDEARARSALGLYSPPPPPDA